MKIDTFRCDGCGALKDKSNHWWLVAEYPGELLVAQWTDELAALRTDKEQWRHYCGRECVQKAIEKFMGGLGTPEPGDK